MSWEEFRKAIESMAVVEPEPIEYRIYYDDFGRITTCSMRNHADGTQYIVVDKEIYETYWQYSIIVSTKKLKKIAKDSGISVQLVKSNQGYAVVNKHAGLILENNEIYTDIEYYDTNH